MKFLIRFEYRQHLGYRGQKGQRTVEEKTKDEALNNFNKLERKFIEGRSGNIRVISVRRK